MDLTVRPIEESEFDTFHAKMARGFGGDPDPKDDPTVFREIIEFDRTVAGATCARTSDGADLELDVSALGALYLGGRSISTLARAGWVRGDAVTLATAGALFAWDPQPWCPEVF